MAKKKFALSVRRSENFADWYQDIVRAADLAEVSPTRGCMIIKPWGYGIWELIQADLDRRFKETGHQNCYFPLFIPQDFIQKEADHVEGFAKEMAVVTHHRLKSVDGQLQPDPDAKLEQPLVVRPTSETIIGHAFSQWIQSHRDLPLLINQWANVVRWEMRPRLFLRTVEFLWQEGHTAHADQQDAVEETMRMLGVYRDVAQDVLAMKVIDGEKTENERFPGAVSTYSIEAMMQDGKALQAGTSHYLGTNFAQAQGIQYNSKDGGLEFCHTTSWGVSTRLIGGVIMSHGDDDGLRLPPRIAPQQIVILPMMRNGETAAEVSEFCDRLKGELNGKDVYGSRLRTFIDRKDASGADKRWDWVRKGAPLIVEVGPRDVADGKVTFLRRDALRTDDGKLTWQSCGGDEFANMAPSFLTEIQNGIFARSEQRTQSNIENGITSYADVEDYFAAKDDKDDVPGWTLVPWCKPTGAELTAVEDRLKQNQLSLRVVPFEQPSTLGQCALTGKDAVEAVLVGRAY